MANAWSIRSWFTVRQAIDAADTTQQHELGTRVFAFNTTLGLGEFMYVKGATSVAAADWCTIAEDYTLVRLVADADGAIGIAMSAISSATTYGWVGIYGKFNGLSAGSIVDGAKIYASGTTAAVDDAVQDGDLVHNALCRSTVSGAVATGEFQIWYPYCDNITTND